MGSPLLHTGVAWACPRDCLAASSPPRCPDGRALRPSMRSPGANDAGWRAHCSRLPTRPAAGQPSFQRQRRRRRPSLARRASEFPAAARATGALSRSGCRRGLGATVADRPEPEGGCTSLMQAAGCGQPGPVRHNTTLAIRREPPLYPTAIRPDPDTAARPHRRQRKINPAAGQTRTTAPCFIYLCPTCSAPVTLFEQPLRPESRNPPHHRCCRRAVEWRAGRGRTQRETDWPSAGAMASWRQVALTTTLFQTDGQNVVTSHYLAGPATSAATSATTPRSVRLPNGSATTVSRLVALKDRLELSRAHSRQAAGPRVERMPAAAHHRGEAVLPLPGSGSRPGRLPDAAPERRQHRRPLL